GEYLVSGLLGYVGREPVRGHGRTSSFSSDFSAGFSPAPSPRAPAGAAARLTGTRRGRVPGHAAGHVRGGTRGSGADRGRAAAGRDDVGGTAGPGLGRAASRPDRSRRDGRTTRPEQPGRGSPAQGTPGRKSPAQETGSGGSVGWCDQGTGQRAGAGSAGG